MDKEHGKKDHRCEHCGADVTDEQREMLHKSLDEIASGKGVIMLLQSEKIDENHSEMSAKVIIRQLHPVSIIDGLIEADIIDAEEILKFILMKNPKILDKLASIAMLAHTVKTLGLSSRKKKRPEIHTAMVCTDPKCTECKKK